MNISKENMDSIGGNFVTENTKDGLEEIVQELLEIHRSVKPDLDGDKDYESILRQALTTHTQYLIEDDIERMERLIDKNDDGMWAGREILETLIQQKKELLSKIEI